MTQDCEATDLRALQQGEKVKPHKVVAKNNHNRIMELSINFEDVILSKFTSNQNDPQVTCGLFLVNSGVIWEKMEGSNINLTGKSKAKVEQCRDCFKNISIII